VPEDVFWEKFIRLPGAVKNLLRVLAHRMRKVNEEVLRSQEEKFKYEQLQKELEAAGKIQANILPQDVPLFPDHPQVDVCATLVPVREVGGDFFDAFALDNRRIYIAIGDVCGKGMPAALFMVRVMALLRTSLSGDTPFEAVLPMVNRMLCENNADDMFASIFVGMFDVVTGKLTYMNGGHNAPFFAGNNDTGFRLLQMPKGMVLGLFDEAPFEVAELTFEPGDKLVLYTDGLTEAENSRQELFSTERAGRVLQTINPDDAVTSVVKTLLDAVTRFAKGGPQSDDITLLSLHYLGNTSSQK
jgi:sigma-B regulation protein RsbU (phosphoserine phosphatase)